MFMMLNREQRLKLIFPIFARIPFSLLRRLARTNLIIPYYHMISDENILHVKHLYRYKTTREFREDLDFLLKTYSPMGLIELLNYMKTGRPLPERVFLLTFDDGHREISEIVAPILLEKGISATIFVNSSFIDNKQLCYLNKASLIVEHFQKCRSSSLEEKVSRILDPDKIGVDDIRSGILSISYQQRALLDEIANVVDIDFSDYLLVDKPYLTSNQINKLIESGFTIGAHSIDHPVYSSLSLEDQLHQTIESVKLVREMFHLSYGVFAFPHSDHNVSKEFFTRLSHTGLVDLTFGTAGLIDDSVPNHLQRFSLEKPIDTAEKIVAFQHARKLKKLVTRRSRITRH